MTKVYLSLGGNTGNRYETQQKAIDLMAQRVGEVVVCSGLYETAPWGFEHDQDFLNQVVVVETALTPNELLNTLLRIETELGRKRSNTNGYEARSIDLDVLFFGDEVVNEGELIIPHPKLHERRFILVPLNDIAAQLNHPVLNQTIAELLMKCPDQLAVEPYQMLQS